MQRVEASQAAPVGAQMGPGCSAVGA